MDVPLEPTVQPHRLRPPSLPAGFVDRPRLTTPILATDPGGVCVLTAPPGYGASTAMAVALRSGVDAVAWVSLDRRCDDDEARRHLIAAVVGVAGERGPGEGIHGLLSLLESAPAMWLAVAGIDPGCHPGLLDDLAEVTRHLPKSVRLLISSHGSLPPITLAAGARAVLLDAAELRFDVDEALELLQTIDPGIDIEDSTTILGAAEGWAAALVAAATHARHHDDGTWLVRSGADHLLRDWFSTLPGHLRAFLAETAVLDVLSAEIADAVTARHGSGAALLELDARQAFLTEVAPPEGHDDRWWVRHPLLTRYLRQRTGPDSPQRHSRAADWFQERNDVDRTMQHLMAAGRSRDVGAYLIKHESELLSAGRADEVLQWYDQLPAELGPRAVHLLRIGWGQTLSGDLRGADATAARLAADLASAPRAEGMSGGAQSSGEGGVAIAGEVALLRAYLAAFHADPATMIAEGRQAVAELAGRSQSDSQQLAPLLVVRGLLWSGQPQAAQRMLDRFHDQPFPTEVIRESNLAGTRSLVAAANGSINQARVWADAALQWHERQGLEPLAILQYGPMLARGIAHLESGEPATALDVALAVSGTAERNGHLGDAVTAWMLVARVETARGDLGAALRTIAQARDLATNATPASTMVIPLDELQARVRTFAGDFLRAERLLRSLPPSDARTLDLARVGLLSQPVTARRALESLQPLTPVTRAERHLLLASSYLKTSRRMAEGHLIKAASIAHENGLGLLLANSDAPILDLAHDTALHNQDDAIVWLLRRRDDARQTSPESVPTSAPTAGPALSRGELQLLALLPSRARNADIADALGVSINTIKTRLRRLYAKLGAENRDAAVERAARLGITNPL